MMCLKQSANSQCHSILNTNNIVEECPLQHFPEGTSILNQVTSDAVWLNTFSIPL